MAAEVDLVTTVVTVVNVAVMVGGMEDARCLMDVAAITAAIWGIVGIAVADEVVRAVRTKTLETLVAEKAESWILLNVERV